TGGGFIPKIALGGSVPVGPGMVNFGFSAEGGATYSVLAPQAMKPQAALAHAQNSPIDLPLNAESARRLERGTDVLLQGRGSLAGEVGVGVGKDFHGIGVSGGIKIGVAKDVDASVKIKKLDGDKVLVSLSRLSSLSG